MRLIKRDSFALKILKGIGVIGLALVAASNPYFGLNLTRGIKRNGNKKDWAKFYDSLRYLHRRGYVKIIEKNFDGLKVEITHKGETILLNADINSMQIEDTTIDDKWRLVIFDIPNKKSSKRIAFTEKLKNMGFIMIQKSVWASPYNCYREIMILRKFYEIEKYVTYLEGVNVEDEITWRGKFNKTVQL